MKQAEIVIIAPEIFPIPAVKGGAVETWIDQVSRVFTEGRLSILGIADKKLLPNESRNNIWYHRYRPSLLDRLLRSTYKLPFKQSTSFLYWRLYAHWCAKHARSKKSDIIHIHNRWQFVPIIRKLNPKAKIVLHFHQVSALNFDDRQARELRFMVDQFITCSQFMAGKIVERAKIRRDKVTIVLNGVDTEQLKPVSGEDKNRIREKLNITQKYVLLYAGRLVENKGAHLLLEAFQKSNQSDAVLVIAGGSTYSDDTQTEYVQKLKEKAGPNVIFTGYIPQKQLWDYYRTADAAIVPSLVEEALSMTMIESMSAGCVPIISNRGGMPEFVIDGENGYVIDEPEDVNAWIKKLKQFFDHSDRVDALAKKSRLVVEEYAAWNHISEKLNEAYRQVLTSKSVVFVETGSGFGGTGKYLYDLLARINSNQIHSRIIYSGEGSFIQKLKKLAFPIIRINLNYQSIKIPVLSYIHFILWQVCIGLPKAFQIQKILSKSGAEVVYLNNEILSHIPTILAAKWTGCKIICHNHGHRNLTSIEKFVSRFVNHFICVSNATGKMTRSSLGDVPISVIHNGLDLDLYQSDDIQINPRLEEESGRWKVGMFGRIVEWKGQEDFIQAAAKVLENHKDVLFFIIGDDLSKDKSFLKRLQSLARDLGIEQQIQFTGWVDNPLSYVKGLDFVIQPSKTPEPFGFTVVEAMSLEKPVIGSRQGALPEIITDGEAGLLFEPNNYLDLAKKMEQLINDKELIQSMGQCARKRVESQFAIGRTVTNVEEIIIN